MYETISDLDFLMQCDAIRPVINLAELFLRRTFTNTRAPTLERTRELVILKTLWLICSVPANRVFNKYPFVKHLFLTPCWVHCTQASGKDLTSIDSAERNVRYHPGAIKNSGLVS